MLGDAGIGVGLDQVWDVKFGVVEHGKTPARVILEPLPDGIGLGQHPYQCSANEFTRHIVLGPDLAEFILFSINYR